VYAGLSQGQIEELATMKEPCLKTSRRDLPFVLSQVSLFLKFILPFLISFTSLYNYNSIIFRFESLFLNYSEAEWRDYGIWNDAGGI